MPGFIEINSRGTMDLRTVTTESPGHDGGFDGKPRWMVVVLGRGT